MPILLTTPVQTGVLDPNGPYLQVKIIQFTLDSIFKRIDLVCQYGNTDGEWVPGIRAGDVADKGFRIEDKDGGTDYTDMITAISAAADEVYYDKVKAILYQWLIDNSYYAGTIV